MTGRFQFRALGEEEAKRAGCPSGEKIRGLYAFDEKEFALTYGRLRTLFGPPAYEESDLENQYCFGIEARDEQGGVRFLYAYSGPTGPAVGGGQEELDRLAADQLAELVHSAEPSDYDYTGYYLDGPCKVRMGVKDGKAYFEESELTNEDFRKMIGR
ncbi:MAG: hypothetical protein HFF29_10145 [Oscillospiraceae bacterium]|nr:hypothetical protein [Oscillospiraceae bacterium]